MQNTKIIKLNLLFLLMVLIINQCSPFVRTKEKKVFRSVEPAEAIKLIEENQQNANFVILDLRTAREYKTGHIKNATNLDFYSDNFKDSLKTLDKSNTYFIYCKGGYRSGKAYSQMKDMGFKRVYNLTGGIKNWEKQGHPVVK